MTACFNLPSPTSNFAPETIMDYEVGWKASMLASHVTTQLGGFYYDYHDFQFQTLNLTNGLSGVQNLPTARIYGVEASMQAHLGAWRGDLGAAYVNSSQPSPGPFVNGHLLPPGVQGPQCSPGQTAGCFDYTPYLTTGSSGPNPAALGKISPTLLRKTRPSRLHDCAHDCEFV
jgi:iron complex outermembrane receptor protein